MSIKTSLVDVLFLLLLSAPVGDGDNGSDPVDPVNPSDGVPEDVELSSTTSATDSQGNTYTVGFDQVSNNDQNPFMLKTNAQGQQLWRVVYENTPVDGRGELVIVDSNDNPWAVFSVDGGSNSSGYINSLAVLNGAFNGVYANGYGGGGGARVSVLAQIDPQTGSIRRGTFVTARLSSNNNTNTLAITQLGFRGGRVAFEIASGAFPPGTGTSYQRLPNADDSDRINGVFKVDYEMSLELNQITRAVLLTE